MMQRFSDGCCHLVPTTDILLMLMTHQSYPTVYATDVKEMEGIMWKIVGAWESVKPNEVGMTKKLWEKTFEEPYEKAGCETISGVQTRPPIFWKVTDLDVNTKYKSLLPRFLSEEIMAFKILVCVHRQEKEKDLKMNENIIGQVASNPGHSLLQLDNGRQGGNICLEGCIVWWPPISSLATQQHYSLKVIYIYSENFSSIFKFT